MTPQACSGAPNLRRRLCVSAVVLGALAAGTSDARAAVLVVDKDKAQCPRARYTSIQQAVDAARPGDKVKVCADHYAEQVTVDKPLRLHGAPDAIEAIDCFAAAPSQVGDLDPARHAIVDPKGDGFSVAFRLAADKIVLRGLVVEGATVGIDASDRFSGHRIAHNLLRFNTLFGIDFGSEGTHRSRVDHNCLRDNETAAIASELDNDSLWKPSDGPERDDWNARDLFNARLDHNATSSNGRFGFFGALQITGPGRRVRVRIDHNVSRGDGGILLQNSTDSAIFDNDVIDARGNAIVIGGGTKRLVIATNRVRDAALAGIRFTTGFELDRFPIPSRDVAVTSNDVTGGASGILTAANTLVDSLISDNTTSWNVGQGIGLSTGNTRIVVRANQTDNNGAAGITAFLGATGNRFEHNSMHGNGSIAGTMGAGADARDGIPLPGGMIQNDWIGNDCDTDIPVGTICGVAPEPSEFPAWDHSASFEFDLASGTDGWNFSTHSVTRTNEAMAADGAYAAKIAFQSATSSGCSCPRMQFERSDPQDPRHTNFVAGEEVWLRGAWRIPDPNAISWSRLMNLTAFTGGSSDYYTGLVVEGSPGQMQVTTRTYSGSVSKPIFPVRPIPVDRWFEVVLHFKLSPTDGRALNEWYIDGQRVASNTNANMVNSQPLIGYQGGVPYLSYLTEPGTVVYFDNPGLAYPK